MLPQKTKITDEAIHYFEISLQVYQKFPGLIKKDSSQVVGKNGQKVSSPEGRFCQITRHMSNVFVWKMSFLHQ